MRRIGIVLLSTLLVTLLFAGIAMAEGPPVTGYDDLIPEPVPEPAVMLGDWSLDEFVLLAYNRRVSVEQVDAYLAHLDEEQIPKLIDLMAAQAGFDPEVLRKERRKHLSEVNRLQEHPYPDLQAMSYPVPSLWRQNIERKTRAGGKTVDTYYVDYGCENDYWYDPDKDWVFHFNMGYSMNPDGLRWGTTDPWVHGIFWAAYRNNINGFTMGWDHAKLCIGNVAVQASGGPSYLRWVIYLTSNN